MPNPWMQEHLSDYYVKQAKRQGYPSRAAYKLLEIQQKDKLITPGMTVVDLGAAPGGWSVVAVELLKGKGQVIALDCLPMTAPPGVHFIQGDFTEAVVLQELLAYLGQQTVDLVLSDMAPNISGLRSVDQPKSMYLAELAADFAKQVLVGGGKLLTKLFQGEGVDHFIAELRKHFTQVKIRKPAASRSRSREVYVLAQGFRR
ncbi:MAG: 23S rRNA (uridine(2552)-2'-O)-methyltransferase RlmE [Proteobacteria bacterium]|nr:23S rRNA (uridine(2552)-2'-O)-methyltransferase RlmE [Pseudomonadota bacterium]